MHQREYRAIFALAQSCNAWLPMMPPPVLDSMTSFRQQPDAQNIA